MRRKGTSKSTIPMSTRKLNVANRFLDFEDMWDEKDQKNEQLKKVVEKKQE